MARRHKSDGAPGPTADESALFHKELADVVPLVARGRRVLLEPAPPHAIVRTPQADDFFIPSAWVEPEPCSSVSLSAAAGKPFKWLRPGLPRKLLDDLIKARWKVEAQLDLHGLDRDAARDHLIAFIDECLAARLRCVCVVHGQGRIQRWMQGGSPELSEQEPVLKSVVRRWMAHRPEVLAYCQAPARSGGRGAVWVLLRMRRRD